MTTDYGVTGRRVSADEARVMAGETIDRRIHDLAYTVIVQTEEIELARKNTSSQQQDTPRLTKRMEALMRMLVESGEATMIAQRMVLNALREEISRG